MYSITFRKNVVLQMNVQRKRYVYFTSVNMRKRYVIPTEDALRATEIIGAHVYQSSRVDARDQALVVQIIQVATK